MFHSSGLRNKELQKSTIALLIQQHTYADIKGYLRYKTVTSQNVSSEVQIKNFFIS